ncbi:WXG100 family type VII secretion target [Knoellia sp. CPCC 206453]|uniref:WXG100 family type VII secretion target n=1 Tax=Knoellia pratensis TaxID=3404796 RepID=UPI00361DAAEB
MTRMQIGAEVIAALGVSLGDVASDLESTKDGEVDRWAMGGGEASEAFDDLLYGWRRNRLLLARVLRDLSEKAQNAGQAYVETEVEARRMFGGETR